MMEDQVSAVYFEWMCELLRENREMREFIGRISFLFRVDDDENVLHLNTDVLKRILYHGS